MRKTIIVCDSCGKDIEDEKSFSGTIPRIEREFKIDGTCKERISLRPTDLCNDCGKRIASLFAYIDVPEEDFW